MVDNWRNENLRISSILQFSFPYPFLSPPESGSTFLAGKPEDSMVWICLVIDIEKFDYRLFNYQVLPRYLHAGESFTRHSWFALGVNSTLFKLFWSLSLVWNSDLNRLFRELIASPKWLNYQNGNSVFGSQWRALSIPVFQSLIRELNSSSSFSFYPKCILSRSVLYRCRRHSFSICVYWQSMYVCMYVSIMGY